MIILHYTLGLEPERSGGMIRYATDLMKEQQSLAEDVVLLYPQGWKWYSKDISWHSCGQRDGIDCYCLYNTFALPVPLRCGIGNPEAFISSRRMSTPQMESLYNKIKPDVFHVHTLMGLPCELLMFFKSKGVKLVYTAHDYFGICPKVNMINSRGEVCDRPSEQSCRECHIKSKPTIFLRVYNSGLFLKLKQYVKDRL